MEERCICCGDIIPEGKMICWNCEQKSIKLGSILQSNNATAEEVNDAYEWLYTDTKGEINDKE